jgi:hypothetical protein
VGRNLSRLALALVIFVAVFLPSTRSVHSTSGGRIATDLVETTAGVYASPDCAVGWWEQGDNTEGLAIYALASHPESPNIYAGTWGHGVYTTTSGLNSWSPVLSLGTHFQIPSLAIDPSSPENIVYAGTMGNGVKRSDSGGANWMDTMGLGGDVWSLAVTATADPIYAYAGTAGEIYISTDGTMWNLVEDIGIDTEKFYALVVDPQDSKTAYVGTKEKGVHWTTDGGISWTESGLPPVTVRALALHPDNSEIIYAGTQSAGTQSPGIFKSTDGGASWPVSGLVGHDVMAIAVNPRNPEFVYAGTFGEGIWASYNGGHSWHIMSGLTSEVYSLTLFTPAGEDDCQVLYAGTTNGVWARAVTSFCISYLPLVYKDQ